MDYFNIEKWPYYDKEQIEAAKVEFLKCKLLDRRRNKEI